MVLVQVQKYGAFTRYKLEILHQINVAKGLKLKFKKFCGLIYRFVEVTPENQVGRVEGGFLPPIHPG